jgi:hypothetical protein
VSDATGTKVHADVGSFVATKLDILSVRPRPRPNVRIGRLIRRLYDADQSMTTIKMGVDFRCVAQRMNGVTREMKREPSSGE